MWTQYTDRVPCAVHHARTQSWARGCALTRLRGLHHDPWAGTPDPAHGSVLGGPGPGERKCSLTQYYGASCQARRRHRTAVGSEVNLL